MFEGAVTLTPPILRLGQAISYHHITLENIIAPFSNRKSYHILVN